MKSVFKPGKITFLMDAQAGSSGKARTSSYILNKHKGEYTFVCNTFSANAAHWVKLDDGRKFLYKTLNSNAYNPDSFEAMYIGPGAEFELDNLLQEVAENPGIESKLKIHPLAVVVQGMDADYEKGTHDFEGGQLVECHDGTMKNGSTCSGVGAAAARRLLRRPSTRLARNVPELVKFLCDVSAEIIARLDAGESGFQEIAQGFQLSLMHKDFYPYTTYRNVTIAHALSDMFLPTKCAGPVILNYRTYPIRINSNKYISFDGHHLTWDEIQAGVPHEVYEGNSGHWYEDQKELTWEELTSLSGSPNPLMEITSKTKLPRRVATFSKLNLVESIKYNDTGEGVFLAINFADYVDFDMAGKRGTILDNPFTSKFCGWLVDNFGEHADKIKFIGTGPLTEDTIELSGGIRPWDMDI